jgi:hypothetical protein
MSPILVDFTDSRGNRLREGILYKSASSDEFYICLHGCLDVAKQVELLLGPDGRPIDPHRVDASPNFDSAFRYSGPRRSDVDQLVDVLKHVLTLRQVPELDVALALDFYKEADEYGELVNTKAGALIRTLKYYTSNPAARTRAGSDLVGWMCDIIQRHPLLARADRLVVVPSTNSNISEWIGARLSAVCGKPHIVAVETTGSTAEDKAGDETSKQYRVDADLTGEEVIVVDDVYWKGRALRGVGSACRVAGAERVYGLVGARNLRGG